MGNIDVTIGTITITDPNGYVGAGGAVVLLLIVILVLRKAGLPDFIR